LVCKLLQIVLYFQFLKSKQDVRPHY
jgi:hypothetical protein